MNSKKIGRVIELADQRELMIERVADIVRDPFRVAAGGAFPGEMDERVLGARETCALLMGVFVAQLVEREGQRLVERQRLVDCRRRFLEQARHFCRRLEIAFGIGGKTPACPVDDQVLADAGEHVLQFPPVGMMIERIVDGDERKTRLRRQTRALHQARAVIAAVEHADSEPHAVRCGLAQQREQGDGMRAWLFARHQPQPRLGV